ncbi:DNA-directed RNA polymerase II subunit RPB1-like, partial [Homarus americanus]|uniref:DNA-directed RNA polymerase II subunit RPB1-like n=1 Tax=Homarus americanus TaxID=6706 RepID=UPI001C48039E
MGSYPSRVHKASPPEPTNPEIEPTNPKIEPTNPEIEPTNPEIEPTNPKIEPTNPEIEPTNPKIEPTNPKIEPTNPARFRLMNSKQYIQKKSHYIEGSLDMKPPYNGFHREI